MPRITVTSETGAVLLSLDGILGRMLAKELEEHNSPDRPLLASLETALLGAIRLDALAEQDAEIEQAHKARVHPNGEPCPDGCGGL